VIAVLATPGYATAQAPPARPGPPDSLIPADALGGAIRRGRALVLATRDSLPRYVGNKLRCVSCHLDEGRRPTGSWVGAFARYPQYRSRRGGVETIEDRVNDCFKRSMNGRPLDRSGRDMHDLVAYLAFLSWGTPVGPASDRGGASAAARFATLRPDTAAGARTFGTVCAACHGVNGQGGSHDAVVAAPPLWGAGSFNIGAGMARLYTAATFVRNNMPFDKPGSLSDQEALDVAAFVNHHPRPDYPGKELDWPKGDPPPDVAYPTAAERRKH